MLQIQAIVKLRGSKLEQTKGIKCKVKYKFSHDCIETTCRVVPEEIYFD